MSQIIVVLGSLLIARLYTVEDIGLFTLFTSLVTIFAVVSTGRYEYAILIPEKKEDAKSIINVIFIIGLIVSFTYLIIILLVRNIDVGKYNNLIHSPIIFVFPLYILLISINSALVYWNQRYKNYKRATFVNLILAIANTGLSIFLGVLRVKYGLFYGLLLGVVSAVVFNLVYYKEVLQIFPKDIIIKIAKRYISYPKFMLVSDLSTTSSQQILPIVFSSLFTSTIVGYYAMANRILRLPTIVITSSISDVFRNEVLERIRTSGNCESLYIKTLKKLLLIGLVIFSLIYFFSPFAIRVLLGEKWSVSGVFAQILCIQLFFEFISTPLNSLFYIFEKQKIYMLIQFINSVWSVLVIMISYHFFSDAKISLLSFCMSSVIFNCVNLYFTHQLSIRKIK